MPVHVLDETDRRILNLLQQDARLTVQEVAELVGLSPSPCHRRMRQLEERGVIETQDNGSVVLKEKITQE